MRATARSLFISLLIGGQIAWPTRAFADNTAHASVQQLIQAQSDGASRAWVISHVADSSATLSEKAFAKMHAGPKLAGSLALNDGLQVTIILLASSVAQLVHDRMERDHLADGYKPSFQDVQRQAVSATQELLCGKTNPNAGVTGEIFCSGEFWLGTAGGIASSATVQVAVNQILKGLLKLSPTRAALISLIGTTAASFLVLTGFQLSAYLWTEAVHVLNNPEQEAKARKLFGRAVEMKIRGQWAEYLKTEDGQLAAQVFENMRNILIVDPAQRSQWMYNAYRFGLARGEMIVNLSVLMSALSAGTIVGTSLAAAVGLPAWAMAFAVSSAFGAGVSALIAFTPDLGVGDSLTLAIQNTRAWFAQNRHSSAKRSLEAITQVYNTKIADDPRYQDLLADRWGFEHQQRETLAGQALQQMTKDRMTWTGIAIEKYQDLRNKMDEAEMTLDLAQAAIQNSKFRDSVILKDGQQLMTYAQARQKYCGSKRSCDFKLSYQLRKIEDSRKIVGDGEKALAQIGQSILDLYQDDADFLHRLKDNRFMALPPRLASQIASQSQTLDLVSDSLAWDFSSLYPSIQKQEGASFTNEEERQTLAQSAAAFLAQTYIQGFNETEFYNKLADASQ